MRTEGENALISIVAVIFTHIQRVSRIGVTALATRVSIKFAFQSIFDRISTIVVATPTAAALRGLNNSRTSSQRNRMDSLHTVYVFG